MSGEVLARLKVENSRWRAADRRQLITSKDATFQYGHQ